MARTGGNSGAVVETPREAPDQAPDGKSVRFTLSRSETDWIVWTLLSVAVFVLAVFCFFAWRDGTGFPWDGIIIVALAMAIPLGVAFWMRGRAHNDRSAHLVISAEGILAPKAVDRLITWDALEKISYHDDYYKGQRRDVFMALHTLYPDRFGAKRGSWTRKINRWWYGTDIVFPLEALAGEPEDVMAAVKRFAPPGLIAGADLDIR